MSDTVTSEAHITNHDVHRETSASEYSPTLKSGEVVRRWRHKTDTVVMKNKKHMTGYLNQSRRKRKRSRRVIEISSRS